MRTQIRNFKISVFGLSFFLVAPALAAQQLPTQQKPGNVDFTALFSLRSNINLPIASEPEGTNPRVVIDAGPAYGFTFGGRNHDEDVYEIRWARQNSIARLVGAGPISLRQGVTVDQIHLDFTHEYILDEWPKWARPFVIGSVGATRISIEDNTDTTRFSFGLGAGVKLLANRHLGVRMQAQWLPIVVNPQITIVCGIGCVFHIRSTLRSQAEVAIGPLLRF